MLEGLVARLATTGSSIYKSLQSREPESYDFLSYDYLLHETLSYYTAMFESIDVILPRNHKERINVEQHCLASNNVNIIACEGAERIKRHELLGKWKSRFSMAGFEPYPLSSVVSATIRALLKDYNNGYGIEERDGALYLGWVDRILVSSCAWK
ncbi:BnaA07g04510D [Brassica napus]|uniref:BnaA07g04510D protein n=1 Tax=Brassica napus TaxID=3708 RepID=A0A078GR10_BRANA|nr:BnaA07g04510D [Brassica napus]